MTQLAIDGMTAPTPRRHRGPLPVYGPRTQITARIDDAAADVLRRRARESGESFSAYMARILEAAAMT